MRNTPDPQPPRQGLAPEIYAMLDQALHRVRRIILLRGLLAVGAVTLLTALAAIGVDAMITLYSVWARWLLSCSVLLMGGLSYYWYLRRPLSKPMTQVDIARVIENRNTGLHERISSAVQLLGEPGAHDGAISQRLLDQLVSEAGRDAGKVTPDRLFTWRTAKRFGVVLGVTLGVYLLLFAIWPRSLSRLLGRTLLPFARIGNVQAARLTVDPGDVELAVGESLSVRVTVHDPALGNVEIRTLTPGEGELIERMTAVPDAASGMRHYVTTFPAVEQGFDYRIRAGRALTRYYKVRAFDRPEVARLLVRESFPAYTGLPPRERELPVGEISTLAGTSLKILAGFSTRVREAELMVGDTSYGAPEPLRHDRSTLSAWRIETGPEAKQSTWRLRIQSHAGHENLPEEHAFVLRADQEPSVVLADPLSIRLPPDAVWDLPYTAQDDFGIAAVYLKVAIDHRGQPLVPLALPVRQPERDGSATWIGSARIDLAGYDTREATRVRVQIVVDDNRGDAYGGAQRATSEPLVIILDREAQSPAMQALQAQQKALEAGLDAVVDAIQEAHQKAQDAEALLAAETPAKTGEAEARIDEVRQEAMEIAETLRETAAAHADTAFAQQAEALRALADKDIAEARRLSEAVLLAEQPTDKQEKASALTEQLAQALVDAQAQRALLRAEDLVELAKAEEQAQRALLRTEDQPERTQTEAEALQRVEDLAHRQAALAQEAQGLADADGERVPDADWSARQEELANALAELAQEARADTAGQAEADEQRAQERAEALAALQDTLDKAGTDPVQQREALEAFVQDRQEMLAADGQALVERATEAQREQAERARQLQEAAEQALQAAKAAEDPALRQQVQEDAQAAQQAAEAAQAASEEATAQAEAAQQVAEAAQAASDGAAMQVEQVRQAAEQAQAALDALRQGMPEAAAESAAEAQASWEQASADATFEGREAAAQLAHEQQQVQAMLASLEQGDLPQALEQGRQALEQAAQQRAVQRHPLAAQLQQAAEQGAQAAAAQNAQAAAAAAEAAAQLAQAARQIAAEIGFGAMGADDVPSDGVSPLPAGPDRAAREATAFRFFRRRQARASGDWTRGRDGAGSHADAVGYEDVPPAYRDLVQQYFRELAREPERRR